jgi:hypothetical protein
VERLHLLAIAIGAEEDQVSDIDRGDAGEAERLGIGQQRCGARVRCG